MITKSRVKGMLAGIAVGDAAGMPVEGWTAEQIKAMHPNGIQTYVSPEHHKYFKSLKPGQTTDDTFFTVVTGHALVEAGKFDMNWQSVYHVQGLKQSPTGMGKGTKEAEKDWQLAYFWENRPSKSRGRQWGANEAELAFSLVCFAQRDFPKN